MSPLVILAVLGVVLLVLVAAVVVVNSRDQQKLHPSQEDQQKTLSEAYSMTDMTTDEYERQLQTILNPKERDGR